MAWNIVDWCVRVRQSVRSRYVRMVEEELAMARAEVERLREENRALLNSLLGTAGVPPIEVPRTQVSTPAVRRRSWSQIATVREIEAARAEQKREREARRNENPHP
jgi:hypothetical protein